MRKEILKKNEKTKKGGKKYQKRNKGQKDTQQLDLLSSGLYFCFFEWRKAHNSTLEEWRVEQLSKYFVLLCPKTLYIGTTPK